MAGNQLLKNRRMWYKNNEAAVFNLNFKLKKNTTI